jgi:hypothetical protein
MEPENKEATISQDTPVAITLTAAQWANVLMGVDELPRRIAQPIVTIINGTMLKAANDENGEKVVVPEEAGKGAKEVAGEEK